MDWVHCNTCFVLASDGKSRFHLTSCGHIFCNECIAKDEEKKCKTCGQNYTGAIYLSNQMKPDVQIYFTDVKDICKSAITQMQQAQQVSEFQKGHSRRLAAYRSNQGYQVQDILAAHDFSYPKTPNVSKAQQCSSAQYPTTPGLKSNYSQNMQMQMQSGLHHTPLKAQLQSPLRNIHSGLVLPQSLQSSPLRLNQSVPTGVQLSLVSPSSINRSANMVSNGRISLRTPPVNGKLGPIVSPSLHGISPRLNRLTVSPYQRDISSQRGSKITQNLNVTQSASSQMTPQLAPLQRISSLDEKRPIQLGHLIRPGFPRFDGTRLYGAT
ncbi:probable E3 SUMO-protein ligase RNF212 isoform X5 [Hydra vulgaris]|uniref:Probable E3 SUMO-protein ligase RNF212 isoform X5 n=1 Tax=Hydra vulgaris TaxID=6087 RepID=A0ABM4DKK8_HYDVU